MLMLNDTPSFPTAFFAYARGRGPDPGQHLAPARGLPLLRGEQPRTRRGLRPDAPRDYPESPRRYDEEPVEVIVTNGRAEGAHVLEDLLEGGEDELDPVATHRDDPAFWLYSSGSLGNPRARSTFTTTSSTPARPMPGTCWRSPKTILLLGL